MSATHHSTQPKRGFVHVQVLFFFFFPVWGGCAIVQTQVAKTLVPKNFSPFLLCAAAASVTIRVFAPPEP